MKNCHVQLCCIYVHIQKTDSKTNFLQTNFLKTSNIQTCQRKHLSHKTLFQSHIQQLNTEHEELVFPNWIDFFFLKNKNIFKYNYLFCIFGHF